MTERSAPSLGERSARGGGERSARGGARRTGLTRAAIARAAIELVERDGVEELTMRRLAGELGAGTMTLYTHVRGRGDLLSAIVEQLIVSLDMPGVVARAAGDWRALIEAVLGAYRELADRFPRSFELLALAPYADGPVAPHLASAERAFIAAGLAPTEARWVLGTADAFATGFLVVRVRTAIRAEGGAAAAAESHGDAAFSRGVRAVVLGVEALLSEEGVGAR